jgi:hypothetical protein
MNMKRYLLIAITLAAACGGHKHADTTPSPGQAEVEGDANAEPSAYSGVMISQDKMDEVSRDLKRKSMIMSQCLAEAVDAGKLKKPASGNVALEIVIGTSGKAESVKVNKSDFDDSVNQCVIGHIRDIAFPTMPKNYETSFTYPMEVN